MGSMETKKQNKTSSIDESIKGASLRLYLVERTDTVGWDQFDSFVCVADSIESAQQINPSDSSSKWIDDKWTSDDYEWTNPSTLKIAEIGLPSENLNNGDIVISSFNAG